MKHLIHLIRLALAFAYAFAAPAVAPALAQTATQDAQVLQLLQNGGIFRHACAGNIRAVADNLQPLPGLDDITGSALYDEFPEVWSYAFSTTVMLVGNAKSTAPITAYYSPFLDAAVYVLWRVTEDGYEPTALRLRAVDYPQVDTQGVARWLLEGASPNALQSAYQIFRRQFERDYPFYSDVDAALPAIGNGEENLALFEARAAQAVTDLAGYLNEDADAVANARAAAENFAAAAAGDDAESLRALLAADSALDAEEILQIPQSMRAQLTPSFIVGNDSGVLIYQQVPSAPAFIGVLGVAPDASNQGNAFLFMNLDIEAQTAKQ